MAAPSTSPSLPPALADAVRDDASLRRFLHGLPGVDQVGVEQRAAGLGTRSIKKASKMWAIDTAISMVDLTTLEGADTHGKVRSRRCRSRTSCCKQSVTGTPRRASSEA
jgi:deoxyribose-phosphate aldolase